MAKMRYEMKCWPDSYSDSVSSQKDKSTLRIAVQLCFSLLCRSKKFNHYADDGSN